MQNLYHLIHRCIKGLWIIKQVCTCFVCAQERLKFFFTLQPHPFSVSLACRSVEILVVCDTYVVSHHLDTMVCVVKVWHKSSLLGENSLPGKGVGTGGGVHRGKYWTTPASAWQHPGWGADAFCEGISHLSTVSLQLGAVIALCTTAVNQHGMGFWNHLSAPKHSWCNRSFFWPPFS